jgi:hypothetical protein
MGTIRSHNNWVGSQINDVWLGEPVIDDGWYVWDHELLPDGIIDNNGHIISLDDE